MLKKIGNSLHNFKMHFMAMSKLIGLTSFTFTFAIVVFAMYEMHISQTYDSLPQLIISAFAFSSVYAGFYLTMAKVEHLEDKKMQQEIDLIKLEKEHASQDIIQEKRQQINDLISKMTDLMSEENHSIL